MKNCNKIFMLIGILCITVLQVFSQIEDCEYRVPILKATEGWNIINFPQDIYGKINKDFSDIRVYHTGQGNKKPTEQPYIVDIQSVKKDVKNINFKSINESYTKGLYSITFELSNKESVNKLHLDFGDQNFDWNLTLEGSMNQNSWSTIVDDYRIISLKNQNTNFKFTDIAISESKYNFYKLSLSSSVKPKFKSARLTKEVSTNSNLLDHSIVNSSLEEDDKSKTTSILLDLGTMVPVSHIEVTPTDKVDYYRPVLIEGIVDSFETEKGWKYNYIRLFKGTINSFDDNVFTFKNKLVKKLKITIYNFDNQPLTIKYFVAKGPNHRLITRLNESENIFLAYGNKDARTPNYDIAYFKDKIPDKANVASLGTRIFQPNTDSAKNQLFKNKWWLWIIMIVMILLLGTFTLKMLREEK